MLCLLCLCEVMCVMSVECIDEVHVSVAVCSCLDEVIYVPVCVCVYLKRKCERKLILIPFHIKGSGRSLHRLIILSCNYKLIYKVFINSQKCPWQSVWGLYH